MSRTLSAAVVLSVLATAACWTEGPVGFVPGGPFSGEPEHGPEPDWSFALDTDSVDIEIGSEPPRSVRTGIVVHEGLPYLPVTWSPLKRWPAVVGTGQVWRALPRPLDPGSPARAPPRSRTRGARRAVPRHAAGSLALRADFTFYFRLDPPSAQAAGR